jgi:SAM-dependent methyltransferase
MATPSAHETAAYPTLPFRQCHPDRLHVVGRLFGLAPPPVETCRVLEVGCGSGTHLLAAAAAYPRATFVGLDLTAASVRRGQSLAAAAGITNVELLEADLMDYRPPAGSFDYVTAHGFYSWVPQPVRDRYFDLARESLAPTGLGYVSYNAYPGCHIRQMFWEMLAYHVGGATDPAGRLNLARGLAQFLAAGQAGRAGAAAEIIRKETAHLLAIPHPGMLEYDELWGGNTPVYVTGVADHLARHGLRYVADADVGVMNEAAFPPAVASALAGMREKDLVWKEQYLDFLTLRQFRQTVFAHAEVVPATTPQPAAVAHLAARLTERPAAENVDLSPGVKVEFAFGDRGAVAVDSPLAKAALVELADRWPAAVPVAELATRAAARAGLPADPGHVAALSGMLLSLYQRMAADLWAAPPRFAAAAGDRPAVSPLARAQAAAGDAVATLLHQAFEVKDPVVRGFVPLLDGTRDRAALAAELRRRVPEAPAADAELAATVERMLAQVAEAALLVE